jgi:hypothetical protein
MNPCYEGPGKVIDDRYSIDLYSPRNDLAVTDDDSAGQGVLRIVAALGASGRSGCVLGAARDAVTAVSSDSSGYSSR